MNATTLTSQEWFEVAATLFAETAALAAAMSDEALFTEAHSTSTGVALVPYGTEVAAVQVGVSAALVAELTARGLVAA